MKLIIQTFQTVTLMIKQWSLRATYCELDALLTRTSVSMSPSSLYPSVRSEKSESTCPHCSGTKPRLALMAPSRSMHYKKTTRLSLLTPLFSLKRDAMRGAIGGQQCSPSKKERTREQRECLPAYRLDPQNDGSVGPLLLPSCTLAGSPPGALLHSRQRKRPLMSHLR